jgi:hypothetical protein
MTAGSGRPDSNADLESLGLQNEWGTDGEQPGGSLRGSRRAVPRCPRTGTTPWSPGPLPCTRGTCRRGGHAEGAHRAEPRHGDNTRTDLVDPVPRRRAPGLHAGVVASAGHGHRLERLCRYALRPPIAEDRLQMTASRLVALTLRHRWSDGTTHVLFEPLGLLERLAVITPRPRVNLILYHGVLGPRAAWRTDVVRRTGTAAATEERCDADRGGAGHARDPTRPDTRSPSWAELMRRGFGFDVLVCPRCGQRMRLIAPGPADGSARAGRRFLLLRRFRRTHPECVLSPNAPRYHL